MSPAVYSLFSISTISLVFLSFFAVLSVCSPVGAYEVQHKRWASPNRNQRVASEYLEPRQEKEWWFSSIERQGEAAFHPQKDKYKVFRNVKDYGAIGDGQADDTEAINRAISDQFRCGSGCDSQTITPGLVYFPPGTYLVSAPIVTYYYSQLVGDVLNRPTLKAHSNFTGIAVVDANPYYALSEKNWHQNQNNFFRGVRNFIIDTTDITQDEGIHGIHWQVAQATSLINVHFEMTTRPGNKHSGLWIDNGSGGFMSDLTFKGGHIGADMGSQQFVSRSMSFEGCNTAIRMGWAWHWVYHDININNCNTGFDFTVATGMDGEENEFRAGAAIIHDSSIKNTKMAVRTRWTNEAIKINPLNDAANSIILENVEFENVGSGVEVHDGTVLLQGGSTTIDLWAQGHDYDSAGTMTPVQGPITRKSERPSVLLDNNGGIFAKSRPQYENHPASAFVSAKSNGLKGDGTTDDTAAMKALFEKFGGKGDDVIIYFDHGHYLVTEPIFVPVNTLITGEIWAVIVAGGDKSWQDYNNPQPVWKVGNEGEQGRVEISDMNFQTKGPQPGAILMEFNARGNNQGETGLWDVHFRVAGTAGTELETAQCMHNKLKDNSEVDPKCLVAFMLLWVTKKASVYVENSWAWTSDHNLDEPWSRISVYNARGILIESNPGPVWMWATMAEHNTLYQYQINEAKNVFMGMIQTETPYFQENPRALTPFPALEEWNDPQYLECKDKNITDCEKSWALRVLASSDILIYSAGLYSFFQNYDEECVKTRSCQLYAVDIQNTKDLTIYSLNTVAQKTMLNLNGKPLINAADNRNMFADTVVRFAIGDE